MRVLLLETISKPISQVLSGMLTSHSPGELAFAQFLEREMSGSVTQVGICLPSLHLPSAVGGISFKSARCPVVAVSGGGAQRLVHGASSDCGIFFLKSWDAGVSHHMKGASPDPDIRFCYVLFQLTQKSICEHLDLQFYADQTTTSMFQQA